MALSGQAINEICNFRETGCVLKNEMDKENLNTQLFEIISFK
jgi:hypothetical protein